MEAASKSFKLKWWHKIAIFLFVLFSSLFVIFLSLRVNWVEPVDLTGFRFEPLNQNPPLEEMPEDAYIVKLIEITKRFNDYSDSMHKTAEYTDEEDERNEVEGFVLVNPLSRYPNIYKAVHGYSSYVQEIVDLGYYHESIVPSPHNSIKPLPKSIIYYEYLDYMLLTAERGDIEEFKRQFKSYVTMASVDQSLGQMIDEMIGVMGMNTLFYYLEGFDNLIGDKVNLPDLLLEGLSYYESQELPMCEVMRGEYQYALTLTRSLYRTGKNNGDFSIKYDIDWLRNVSDLKFTETNLKYYWKAVIDHYERAPESPLGKGYSLGDLPYQPYIGDYAKYFMRDLFGYCIMTNYGLLLENASRDRSEMKRKLAFQYVLLSLKRFIREEGSVPQKLSLLPDKKMQEMVEMSGARLTHFSTTDWYLTAFDPALVSDISNFHLEKWSLGIDIVPWMIRHASKSVEEIFEGPEEEADPVESRKPGEF